MDRNPKRPRHADRVAIATDLQQLLHRGRISNDGLLRLLKDVRKRNMNLDAVSKHAVRDAFLDRTKAMGLTTRMPLASGEGHFDWFFVNPNALVSNLVAESAELQRAFAEALRRHPSSMARPWRLVLGFDEFAPGNKFRVDNARKCMVLSFSFLELEFLESEKLWFTPVCVRTTSVHSCEGGWSAFLKRYLRTHLFGPNGIATAGLALTIDGQQTAVFARLSNLLTDGDGHRVSLDWKGHGSMKPCVKHPNVLRKGSDLAHRRRGFCEIGHTRFGDFQQWSTAEACDCMQALRMAERHVAEGRLTRVDYQDLQKAAGSGWGRLQFKLHLCSKRLSR